MTEITTCFPVQNLKVNTLYQIPLNKILVQVTRDSNTEEGPSTNGRARDQNLFISIRESDSENSGIAIARPKKKKKKIEEESGQTDKHRINIKLEQLLPSIGIKETIVVSDDESQDESKSIIKKFVPVKQVENIIILSDSD